MDTTPNLKLPYIAAAQAQKHVTHNEAIRALDAVVQIAVVDRDLSAPPAAPADGARYIVGPAPTGGWSGQAGRIAAFQDNAWEIFAPLEGWLAWVADEDQLVAWDGAAWLPVVGGAALNPTPLVGVNAIAGATNRLAVASPATLFNHEGAGHQVKVNKAAAGHTASVLFQTAFSGRAEVGTTGDDKLHVKVSPDGTTWREVLVIDPATGRVGIGTAAPAAGFNLVDETNAGFYVQQFSAVDGANLRCARARGTIAAPLAIQAGDRIATLTAFGHDGVSIPGPYRGEFGLYAADNFAPGTYGTELRLATTPNGAAGPAERLRCEAGGVVRPGADNAQDLGASSFRWANIWAANGTIQTSDARDKSVAARLDGAQAAAAVDAVAPVMFRWKVGGCEVKPSATETEVIDGVTVPKMAPVPVAGKRLHAGFLAQEVKAAMDAANVDFGVWGLDDKADPASRQWLRPDQLIPVLWAALRETRAEVARLHERMGAL